MFIRCKSLTNRKDSTVSASILELYMVLLDCLSVTMTSHTHYIHKVFLHYVFECVLLDCLSVKMTFHTHYIHKVFLHYVFECVLLDCLSVKMTSHTHYIHKVFLHCVFKCVLLDENDFPHSLHSLPFSVLCAQRIWMKGHICRHK